MQAQDEIQRVGVDDQIGEAVDQQREARGLQIRRGQHDPSRQQRADAERREQAPGRVELHAVATARAAVALRTCGKRASSSARTSSLGRDVDAVLGQHRRAQRDPHERAHARRQVRDALLQLRQRGFEVALDAQDDLAHESDRSAGSSPPDPIRSRVPSTCRRAYCVCGTQRRIARKRGARERNHVGIHADLAALPQPAKASRSVSATSSQRRARRAQDQIEERRDAELQRGAEHRLDVTMDLALVEFLQHIAREALDAEAEHAKAGATHGREPLGRHRIDAIGADELQVARNGRRAAFAATMASHSGRTRLSLVNTKMSS